MILTTAQAATLRRVLSSCNNVLPKLEMLEALGASNPSIAQRARELRQQREYMCQLATTALEIDRQVGGGGYTPPPPPPPPPGLYTPSNIAMVANQYVPFTREEIDTREYLSGPPTPEQVNAAMDRGKGIYQEGSNGRYFVGQPGMTAATLRVIA